MEELNLNEVTEEIFSEEPAGAAAEETPEETGAEEPEETGAETFEGADEESSEEELAAWEALSEAYPEITAENIPEDVFRLVAQGETPLQAMRLSEIAGLKAEVRALKERLAAAETAQKNRLRTPGSMLGRAAEPTDSFLAGLDL